MLAAIVRLSPAKIGLLLFGMAAPAHAVPAPQARLIHCGADTCLRLSGLRTRSTGAVLMGGHDLAVEGARRWRATVPLSTVRGWAISGYSATLSFVDAQTGSPSSEIVVLPPGALSARPVELATMVVRAY